jgi:hypothetical protein
MSVEKQITLAFLSGITWGILLSAVIAYIVT